MPKEENAFKILLKTALKNMTVVTESDVPSGNLRIDFLIIKRPQQPLTNGLPKMIGKKVIVGEFKSFKDKIKPYTLTSLVAKTILTYETALRKRKTKNPQKQKLYTLIQEAQTLNEYAGILLLAGKNTLDSISRYYNFSCKELPNVHPGVYLLSPQSQLIMDFYLVVLPELEFTKDTILLKLLSSPEERRKAIRAIIEDNDEFMYTLSLYLFKEEVIEMAQKLEKKVDPLIESIKGATEILGLEKIIEAVGIEKAIEVIGIEKVIDTVGIEKVIDTVGIEKVIDTVGIEKMVKKLNKKQKQKLLELLQKEEKNNSL